jgi:Cys-tRNA synthase (O-phospho-L-seryl-tRNA:Cys-tRNA synthase)
MTEEDYEVYQSLPETFTIYRGVAVGRNPKGLSWTQNLETARWFAHRFDREDKKGYIQMGMAKKEDVLAYFNTRNEDEIVYNSRRLQISIYEEV